MKAGIVQFDWTFIFQIINTILLILIPVIVIRFIRRLFTKRKDLEKRIKELEREVDNLKRWKNNWYDQAINTYSFYAK